MFEILDRIIFSNGHKMKILIYLICIFQQGVRKKFNSEHDPFFRYCNQKYCHRNINNQRGQPNLMRACF